MIRFQNNDEIYTDFCVLLSDHFRSATLFRTKNYIHIHFATFGLIRIRSRGVRTKIVRTKVPFGHFSYSEQFRSEKKAFGDRPFGDRACGELIVYGKKACIIFYMYFVNFYSNYDGTWEWLERIMTGYHESAPSWPGGANPGRKIVHWVHWTHFQR
jgi:hypothetical protein